MFAAAWILALAPVLGSADEFHERCAALASDEALARAAAERWLAANLVAERYPDLVAVARTADAEVRARLVRVLAAEPRHLELALELASEPASELVELGREAVRAAVAALEPRLGEPARRGPELRTTLERLAGGAWPRLLLLDPSRPLGEVALELEFSGALELGFTLDPALATRVARGAPEVLVGPWEEALDQLLRAYGLMVEGHGLPPAREADVRVSGFLRVASESERARTGVDLVTEWLLLVAGKGEEGQRVQAARNLAALDLGAVLAWLGRRAAAGDAAALEGVLLAGARGRLVPELQGEALFERLVTEAQQGGRRSALVLAVLEASPVSAERRARLAQLLEGTPAQTWLALHWFERVGGSDERVLARARALLADAQTAPTLRLEALYACARLQRAPDAPVLAGALELLRVPVLEEERDRLARTLAVLGIEPPARDPRALAQASFEPLARLNLLAAWLWNGDARVLGAHLADWIAAAGAEEPRQTAFLAEWLESWLARGRAALLRRALDEARTLAPGAGRALDRLELLLRLVPAGEVAARLARGGWLLSGPAADLALLGALGGYPQPIPAEGTARETLHGALATALASGSTRRESVELLGALERAALGLYSAGRDEEGDALAKRVRTAVRRGPKGELRKWIELDLWPRAPLMSVRDVRFEFESRALPAGL